MISKTPKERQWSLIGVNGGFADGENASLAQSVRAIRLSVLAGRLIAAM